MAAAYEVRNMAPPWMSALNRSIALGLTGFPFGSAAALKAAIVALYTATTGVSSAAVYKPTPRRIAVDVDNEINKYISVGVVPSAVFGAASAAAARAAIQALYVANGGAGVLSANHAGSHLGD